MDSTLPSPTITPSATSARAPIKQLSSMMVGAACNGSSTPPSPAPPEIWQCAPTCAQEPTVAQVSIMVPSPTRAPTLTKLGNSTAPLAMKAERRTTAPGTARKPAARNLASSQPRNLESTLSHHTASPGAPSISFMSLRRKDSSTAFLSHSRTFHSPPIFSATLRVPLSSPSSAVSTASRSAPLDWGPRSSRFSQAASMAALNWLMSNPDTVQKGGKVVGLVVAIAWGDIHQGALFAPGGVGLQPYRGHARRPGRDQVSGDIVEHGSPPAFDRAGRHHMG